MMTQTELMKDLFARFSVCRLRPAGVDKRWTWGATCTRKHVWRLWRRQKSDELHSQSSPGEKALRKKRAGNKQRDSSSEGSVAETKMIDSFLQIAPLEGFGSASLNTSGRWFRWASACCLAAARQSQNGTDPSNHHHTALFSAFRLLT